MTITNTMYYFIDETQTEYFGKKIYSMLFNQDGTVDVLIKVGGHESTKKYPTQQAFTNAHPIQATNVMKWMREHGRKIEEIQFPEKQDVIPITKKCSVCGKIKPVIEFPASDLSIDGTHKDCCNCRVSECQKKKLYCTSNHGDVFIRFERCKCCPVGEP